jgi:tetratricopeptide (TPR) repeat protein
MRISLTSPFRKVTFLTGISVILLFAWALCCQAFLQYWFARKQTIAGYKTASIVQPLNAQNLAVLGNAYLDSEGNYPLAAEYLQRSLRIDPNSSRTWLALATAYQGLGDPDKQREATLNALHTNPKDPFIEWQAATLLVSSGDLGRAIPLMRESTIAQPFRITSAIAETFVASGGDVGKTLLALPSTVDARMQFIQWLLDNHHETDADQVWPSVLTAQDKVTARHTFSYLDSLISRKQVGQAQSVWDSLIPVDPELKKRIDAGNLVEDGDFESDLLNGGFCWRYSRLNGVAVTLDTSTFHGGTRSIALQYDANVLQDSGLSQFIAVEPGARYLFQAFVHGEELESASGIRLAITDCYSNRELLLTEPMLGTFPWREVTAEITAGAETNLVRLQILRSPPSGIIRGKFWLDDVRLEKK